MKILHVINNLAAGGAERLLTELLPHQKRKGHQISVLISNDIANVQEFETTLRESGIHIINMGTSFYSPLQVFKMVRLIKKGKYDIIHSHLFPTQYWLAFASLFISGGCRLVKTEHSVFNERKQYKILRPIEKWIYGRYHAIIAITEAVRDNLSDWLQSDNRMYIVPNGVNLKSIWAQQLKIIRDDYPFFSSNSFNILMVGRFDGIHKDQLSLIEAFSRIQNKDSKLFFAGAGPGEEKAKAKVSELNLGHRVHFLGLRTDVFQLMKMADLNVLSSNTEGLSGVALESMASGKPFLGSDVTGINDVVPDASYTFPKSDPASLAHKIDDLEKDRNLRNEMAEKALDHVKQYDIQHMATKYLSIYHTLIPTN